MYVGDYKQKITDSLDERGRVPSQLVFDMLDDISNRAVAWSVEDFVAEAEAREGEDWRKIYDEKKFEDALHRMIDKHDAELGISWETVRCYLDECKNKNFEED